MSVLLVANMNDFLSTQIEFSQQEYSMIYVFHVISEWNYIEKMYHFRLINKSQICIISLDQVPHPIIKKVKC